MCTSGMSSIAPHVTPSPACSESRLLFPLQRVALAVSRTVTAEALRSVFAAAVDLDLLYSSILDTIETRILIVRVQIPFELDMSVATSGLPKATLLVFIFIGCLTTISFGHLWNNFGEDDGFEFGGSRDDHLHGHMEPFPEYGYEDEMPFHAHGAFGDHHNGHSGYHGHHDIDHLAHHGHFAPHRFHHHRRGESDDDDYERFAFENNDWESRDQYSQDEHNFNQGADTELGLGTDRSHVNTEAKLTATVHGIDSHVDNRKIFVDSCSSPRRLTIFYEQMCTSLTENTNTIE